MSAEPTDVLVIGAGPAGLSAARVLASRGIGKVLVVDREVEPGGIPQFCPHATFGLSDYLRPMSGPNYARRLAEHLSGEPQPPRALMKRAGLPRFGKWLEREAG